MVNVEVKLEQVIKKYGHFKALNGVSFEISKGERVAILGPNGAGKTTLVKLISGQMRATSGVVEVMGRNPAEFSRELRRAMGFVSHNPMLYDELTAYENLKFYAKLYEVRSSDERIKEMLGKVRLLDRKNSKVKTFSRGMKQRLSIARALLHNPELLILDEPTSGLDIGGRKELLEYLKTVEKNKTIILTTHNIGEAKALCERAIIICRGKVVVDCNMEDAEKEYFNAVER